MYLFLKNSVSFLFCVAVFLIRFKKEEGMHTPPLYTFSFFYNNEYCNSWPFILRPCLLLSLGRQRIMHKRKLYRRTSLLFCLCHFVWIFSKHSTYCTVQTPWIKWPPHYQEFLCWLQTVHRAHSQTEHTLAFFRRNKITLENSSFSNTNLVSKTVLMTKVILFSTVEN